METIKEEKKADLEQLLNSLIEKGWKPSGKECSHFIMQHDADVLDWKVIYTAVRKDEGLYNIHYTLRELVSKESGLWQFVCENKLTIVKHPNENKYPRDKLEREEHRGWTREQGYYGEPVKQNKWYNWDTAEYRLIESSLKDESELEDFLLSNIKVEGLSEK